MARTPQRWSCGDDLAQRLQWHTHASLRQGADCSLLIFRPLDQPPPAEKGSQAGAGDALAALAERIRPHVRRSDTIELDAQSALAIVLHSADQEGVHAVFQRLRDLLSTPALPDDRTVAISIGYATQSADQPAESGSEHTIANTIRDAWKPRVLLSVACADVPAHAALYAGEPISRPANPETCGPVTAVRAGAGAARASRQSHLRLVAFETPGAPVDESLRARARALGVPFVQLPARLPASCRSAIAPELARELHAVPIGRSRSILTVAMHDPSDSAAVLRLRSATGLAIFPVLAASDELERALRQIARA